MRRSQRYFTQWAAQYYVAAELIRRGYLVSITLGNAPTVDIFAESHSGKAFMIDVKGLRSPNWWILGKKHEPRPDLFYILVYIPKNLDQRPRFFIMTSEEAMREVEKHLEDLRSRGREENKLEYGFAWKVAFKYENAWHKLPK